MPFGNDGRQPSDRAQCEDFYSDFSFAYFHNADAVLFRSESLARIDEEPCAVEMNHGPVAVSEDRTIDLGEDGFHSLQDAMRACRCEAGPADGHVGNPLIKSLDAME